MESNTAASTSTQQAQLVINQTTNDTELKAIAEKVFNGQRLNTQEGITLYEKGSLAYLGTLANYIREKRHGHKTFFNRNFHIEPTNICVFDCKFCS